MSTIRIDAEHAQLLDRLVANLHLRGTKINKKDLVGKLIEEAAISEGIQGSGELCPLDEDPAWIGLHETFSLGILDLSENVDKYLYKFDGEE